MKTPDLQLIHGDSLDVMCGMADNSVDLILTDPPYYSTALKFDQVAHIDFKAWLHECQRILKPAGVLVSFADFNLLAELRGSKAFKTQYELVWHKSMATGFLDANIRPLRAHEFIGIFTQALKKSTYNPQKTTGDSYIRSGSASCMRHTNQMRASITVNTGKYYPHSVQKFKRDPVRKQHPTQKPLALCSWLINTYSNPGDTVFDGFMGSGSTGVAALKLNRRFIGVELDQTYFDTAVARCLPYD
ncbi:MAG: site-specific DNA-methyltransferase [Methylococcaceae bacterium]